ncbi:hypothetical protein GCM10009696_00270 [Kocuria himachalensis]
MLVRWIQASLGGWLTDGLRILSWVPDRPPGSPGILFWVPVILMWLDRLSVVVLVVGAVMVLVAPPVRYQVHRWEVGSGSVHVRDGLLRIMWRITPTDRIQAVHVRRNLLELALGLSSVIVSTASSYGPLVVVGLDKDRASAVADELERAAQEASGEAT